MAGVDGLNGQDGKDANASCIKCHNTINQNAKEAEYYLSKHFIGTSSARNGKYCARCHTSEGFKEIINKPWATGIFVSTTNDIPNATRISCETCHKHASFDFADDTVTQVLRTTSPVSLAYNNYSKTTDFGKINNLCNTCHQIRGVGNANSSLPFFPFDNTKAATDPIQYKQGQSFSVHDGNQSNLFNGINGYEYPGQTYTRTWKHSTFNCTDCHMNQYNPDEATGGHTLKVNLTDPACMTCHDLASTTATTNILIDLKISELGNLLVARKVFNAGFSAVNTHDYNGLLYDGTTTTVYTSIASNNIPSATTGLVVYGNKLTTGTDNATVAATRIGREWKYGELGAAYNYAYIKSESPTGTNYGVHNQTYALQLLQKSIDWLKAN